jgi:hypothetical protein
MTLKNLIDKIKCWAGYHEYVKYESHSGGFTSIVTLCKYCRKEISSLTIPDNRKEENN